MQKSPARLVALLGLTIVAVAQIITIREYSPHHFIDDGPFFFRYAENIAAGHGYRFNVDEPPVFGASAPLWPLLLAALIRCGVPVTEAAVGLGTLLGVAATLLLTLAAQRIAGGIAAAFAAAFMITNARVSAWMTSGMETPLTLLIVSASILAVVSARRAWILGLLAAVALVHKLDLAPLALLLIVGARWKRLPLRSAVAAALVPIAAWLAFTLWHFGSPIPNSLLTKLSYTFEGPSRTWFAQEALLSGGKSILLMLAPLALAVTGTHRAAVRTAFGFIGASAALFAIVPPPEPYGWYLSPVQPALCFLAGVGFGRLLSESTLSTPIQGWRSSAVLATTFVFAIIALLLAEKPIRDSHRRYVDTVERDREAAGRWIDANAPPDATLLTGFGNIAYYARRETIDASSLNRRPPRLTLDELIVSTRPDFVALCPFGTGVRPEQFVPPTGYGVERVFDNTHRATGTDFYVVILRWQTGGPVAHAPLQAPPAGPTLRVSSLEADFRQR